MKLLALMLGLTLLLSAEGKYSNRRAPGFSLPDLQGNQHDPQDYRGNVVIIDLMLTTCSHCQQLADTLKKIVSKPGNKAVVLSIITASGDDINSARKFVKEHGITWPMLFDSGQVMASYLKITPSNPTIHLPHLFIVDPQGMIRADFDENDNLSEANLAAQIAKYTK